ncbi:MAG TPA: IS1595 family transposase [Saprospiraceae bacterium]|nr:IS1595 family transposase [Saprospiraceae bacterium]
MERPHKVIPGKTVKEKIITKQSRVVTRAIKDTSQNSIQPHVLKHVELGTNFMSDEWSAYNGLNKAFNHSVIDHSKGQYQDGNTCTNTIEGFWTIFKKGTGGIYNKPTEKHLQKFADEFAFRYNTKNLKGYSRLNTYLSGTEKRLTYKDLINEARQTQ